MSLSRRGFLTSILGASAAALVLPKIELAAKGITALQTAAIDGPVWNSTFFEIHKVATQKYVELMAAGGLSVVSVHTEVSIIGEQLSDGAVVNHQLRVHVDENGRMLDAAMAALAQKALSCGLDRYAVFRRVPAVAYCEQIGPLRMVAQYCLHDDLPLLRFDVIGASNARAVQRYHADGPREIRRRLSVYRAGRKPEMF